MLSILHTWGQTLVRHPHVHCVVPAGGLSPDHQRWIYPKYAGFFLPVKVLSRVFRGKFVEALRRAYDRNELDLAGATEPLRDPAQWHAFVDALFRSDWVVYAKPAFGGASAVLRYLGRYTHRVAISNRRLLAFDGDQVSFQWKDYARENRSSHDDAVGDGVSPPLRPTHSPAWFRSHPTVRVSREHLSRGPRGTRTDAPRHTSSGGRIDGRAHDADHRHVTPRLVGVSPMRRRDDHRADPLGDPPRDRHMEFRYLMSPSRVGVSAFDHVIAHVSGEVCLDLPLEHRATALPDARTTTRLDAAVARAPPASPSTSFHARGS